ncbi:hypothetical protein Fmac_017140 [Flemingia macrophylla]|uniref:MBD domain-containing protein n=1 Tax=Flemingia macrophylla TaxID=520843 RepID=A0ABD1M1A9_9FABA
MEHGGSSHGRDQRTKLNAGDIAAMTKSTIEKIKHRKLLGPNTVLSYHDMNSVGYGWLLPGWVAEERRVESGRIYRYYYGPDGKYYLSQKQVLEAFKQLGVIVLDT